MHCQSYSLLKGTEKGMNKLKLSLKALSEDHNIKLQWIPSHCDLFGNETADALAKEGSRQERNDRSTSYQEEKNTIKAWQQGKWKQHHPQANSADPYHKLTRQEQVIIFRLRTGHNRLRQHLFLKFKVGETAQCPCGNGVQDVTHILQSCSLYARERAETWPNPSPEDLKLHGSLEDLQRTVAFITSTVLTI